MKKNQQILNFIKELIDRQLIKTLTNLDLLIEIIKQKKIVYCGFDPTSSTLHIGHLIQIKLLQLLNKAGCPSVIILGAATAQIGDPSFSIKFRQEISDEQVQLNMSKIKRQLKKLLPETRILNNQEWYKNINLIDFLATIGKKFSLNKMIERKGVQVADKNNFLTYSQFSYILLQAYDFFHLWKKYDCRLQIGGSDQLPNIIFGLDLIKKMTNHDHCSVGITTPLLTTKSGKKFAKTEKKNNLFLDEKETSIFDFYQFIFNLSDLQVVEWIKLFYDDFKNFLQKNNSNPQDRIYQKFLAKYLISWVHGSEKWENFSKTTKILIKKNLFITNQCSLSLEEWKQLSKNLTFFKINKNNFEITQFLVKNKIAESLTIARRLLADNGIKVRCPTNLINASITTKIENSTEPYILFRKGKQRFYLIQKN